MSNGDLSVRLNEFFNPPQTMHLQPYDIMTNVHYNRQQNYLSVHFLVYSTASRHFTPFECTQVQDFLWQKDCFECFIAQDEGDDAPYFEINASTSGAFAMYEFTRYRVPYKKAQEHDAPAQTNSLDFFWQKPSALPHVVLPNANAQHSPILSLAFLVVLPENFRANLVQPTCIFYDANYTQRENAQYSNAKRSSVEHAQILPRYFAHQHAKMPDFHDKRYWQRL